MLYFLSAINVRETQPDQQTVLEHSTGRIFVFSLRLPTWPPQTKMSSAKCFLTRFSGTQLGSPARQLVLNVDANLRLPSRVSILVCLCEETAQIKKTTQPVADEYNFFGRRVGIQARCAQSRDSPLEHDWRPGLIGFASVEVLPVRNIMHTLNDARREIFRALSISLCTSVSSTSIRTSCVIPMCLDTM